MGSNVISCYPAAALKSYQYGLLPLVLLCDVKNWLRNVLKYTVDSNHITALLKTGSYTNTYFWREILLSFMLIAAIFLLMCYIKTNPFRL